MSSTYEMRARLVEQLEAAQARQPASDDAPGDLINLRSTSCVQAYGSETWICHHESGR